MARDTQIIIRKKMKVYTVLPMIYKVTDFPTQKDVSRKKRIEQLGNYKMSASD